MSKVKNDHEERWNYIQELLEEVSPVKQEDKKRKYIRRVDNEKTNGHYWQVNIIHDRHRYNKTFADSNCGGKASALLAAIGHRDKLIKELGIIFTEGLRKAPIHPKSQGVYFKRKTSGRFTYTYWVAYWHEPGINGKQVRKMKAFSVHKHGQKRARQKAVKFRKDKIKELYG